MKFDDFEFVKEYPVIIAGKHPLRLYRSRFSPNELDKPIEKVRWHFGFPKKIVEPLCPMLESTPYWGEIHWKEDGDFWIWWLTDFSDINEGVPDKLNKTLERYFKSYNQLLNWFKRSAELQKEKKGETNG
jgi:hypothetical protein